MSDLFFVVSKVLGLLMRPESLLMLAMAYGLLRSPQSLGRRILSGVFVALMVIGLWPVHTPIMAPLEDRFLINPPVDTVAGIIVLGGGEDIEATKRTGWPQVNPAADRFFAALMLAKDHPNAKVLFAGGAARFRADGRESTIARTLLVESGLAPERLILEGQSRNTAENARLSFAKIGGVAPEGTWLLVTTAYHMPRALGTFCAAGWQNLVPFPVDHRAHPMRLGWNLASNLYDLHAALREWIGLAAYRMTGRSTALFPKGCA